MAGESGAPRPREPYAAGMATGRPPGSKRDVPARWVAVVDTRRESRGLALIAPYTRAVRQGDVHEVICTDEPDPIPGTVVDRVATWGFVEITASGMLMVGDAVRAGGKEVGRVAGFDESHLPNHMNIVVQVAGRKTGTEMDFQLDEFLIFGAKQYE